MKFSLIMYRCFSTTCRRMVSSCKEGTKINIDIYKSASPPVAKKDADYPEWLWKLLDEKALAKELEETDLFKFKRKQARKQNVARCRENNYFARTR